MSDKNKETNMLLVRVHPESVETALKDMLDNQKVERGLIFRMDMGKELYPLLNRMLKRGYAFCGMVIGEEDGEIEMLFQRHPKQTEKHKFPEATTPEDLKYKL